jgi:hypothetical protein
VIRRHNHPGGEFEEFAGGPPRENAMPKSCFQEALDRLDEPDEAPMLLPVAHMAPASSMESIAAQGALRPHFCSSLDAELLFLSYGGIHFRGENCQTQDTGQLPVGFLFEPGVLDAAKSAFPFDSGAAAAGRFGPDWTVRLGDYRSRYQLVLAGRPEILSRLVYHLYGSNQRYLEGRSRVAHGEEPPPVPELREFLSADLSHFGVDHRQRTIECLFGSGLTLGRSLLWIGYPSAMGKHLPVIFRSTKPWVPEMFSYSGHFNSNPAAVTAVLEHQASRLVKRFVRLPR